MLKFTHPTEFTGKYPDGWGGFTWLDFDNKANSFHPGDDYNWGNTGDADLGKAVNAIADGVVVYSGSDTVLYGNMIIIRHDLDEETQKFIKDNFRMVIKVLYSLYAHLQESNVAVGNRVSCGSLIGRVGKSGVTYAHLHFELYRPDLDLMDKPWRFYPISWSKEMILRNWLPPYLLIEKAKQYNPQPADEWKKKVEIMKVSVDRAKSELDGALANPNANYKGIYDETINKLNKIVTTGKL